MLNKLASLAEGRKLLLELQNDPVKKKEKLDPAFDKFLSALNELSTGLDNKYNGKAVYNYKSHTFAKANIPQYELGYCVAEDKKIERDYVVHQIHLLAADLFTDESKEAVEKFLFYKSMGGEVFFNRFFSEKDFPKEDEFINTPLSGDQLLKYEYLDRTKRVAQKIKEQGLKSDDTRLEKNQLPAESMYQQKYLNRKRQILERRSTIFRREIKKESELIELINSKKKAALNLINLIPGHSVNVRNQKEKLISWVKSIEVSSKGEKVSIECPLSKKEILNLPKDREVLTAIEDFQSSIVEFNKNIGSIQNVISTENSIQKLETKLQNLREKAFPSQKDNAQTDPNKPLDAGSKVSTANTTQKVNTVDKALKNDPARTAKSLKKRSFSTKAKDFFLAIWKKIKAIFAVIFPPYVKQPGI